MIGAYHMFPNDMKKLQDDSGVKNIVMVHVQNYNSAEDFDHLSALQEMIHEGVINILPASDADHAIRGSPLAYHERPASTCIEFDHASAFSYGGG